MNYTDGQIMSLYIPNMAVELKWRRTEGRWVLMPFTDFDVQALATDPRINVR